jgi:pSer/pThr/pTyr-binding forkhead associated (FHA) protein
MEPSSVVLAERAPTPALHRAMLVGLSGHVRDSRYLLDRPEHQVGRGPDNDIWLDDVTIGKQHAVLERADSDWLVTDHGTVGGTWVNGIPRHCAVLEGGDVVRFGAFEFAFVALDLARCADRSAQTARSEAGSRVASRIAPMDRLRARGQRSVAA